MDESVLEVERALQRAQLTSDVAELERLLHPDLLAVAPDGSLAGKEEDLESHRTGVFEIDDLQQEDLQMRVAGDTAVTFVLVALRGRIAGDDVSGRIRYTRTWTRTENGWQVLGAHIAPVPV